jgi:hypothetical protein
MMGGNMRSLVREHDSEFVGCKNCDRATTDDDSSVAARQGVRGGSGMVDYEGVWNLNTLFGDEVQQLAVISAGPPQADGSGEQHSDDDRAKYQSRGHSELLIRSES